MKKLSLLVITMMTVVSLGVSGCVVVDDGYGYAYGGGYHHEHHHHHHGHDGGPHHGHRR